MISNSSFDSVIKESVLSQLNDTEVNVDSILYLTQQNIKIYPRKGAYIMKVLPMIWDMAIENII